MAQKKVTKQKKSVRLIVGDILLILVPALLISGFFLLLHIDKEVNTSITKFHFYDQQIAQPVSSYPMIANEYPPYLTALSAIILDDTSQVVLFEKNPNLRFSMASTTKIMTALVALEHYQSDDILTIQSDDIEGAEVGFKKGEKFTFIDVLHGMMLPSGNDAAYAIAENYPGGLNAFVEKMNQKAAEYHLYATHYADPAGLNDDGNYTTAKDLARLASIALKNPTLKKIASTKNMTITSTDGAVIYQFENLNKLLGYFGVTGLKTGFTEGAGGVLATSRIENGRTYIIVVIKSEDRFVDTLNLISYMTGRVVFFRPED